MSCYSHFADEVIDIKKDSGMCSRLLVSKRARIQILLSHAKSRTATCRPLCSVLHCIYCWNVLLDSVALNLILNGSKVLFLINLFTLTSLLFYNNNYYYFSGVM
jgi:hypothetical protein